VVILDSDSFRVWLESQDWFNYFNWLFSQPSDEYLSAFFLIGLVLAVGLIIVVVALLNGGKKNEKSNRRNY